MTSIEVKGSPLVLTAWQALTADSLVRKSVNCWELHYIFLTSHAPNSWNTPPLVLKINKKNIYRWAAEKTYFLIVDGITEVFLQGKISVNVSVDTLKFFLKEKKEKEIKNKKQKKKH